MKKNLENPNIENIQYELKEVLFNNLNNINETSGIFYYALYKNEAQFNKKKIEFLYNLKNDSHESILFKLNMLKNYELINDLSYTDNSICLLFNNRILNIINLIENYLKL